MRKKERVEFTETVINEEKFGFVFGFDSFFLLLLVLQLER